MKLHWAAPVFFVLILAASAVPFVGYYYLGLASEYRFRNFTHLAAVDTLDDFLDSRPVMRSEDVEIARKRVLVARAQAVWCLQTLSEWEKQLFKMLGAAEALEICASDIATADTALGVLDVMTNSTQPAAEGKSLFALGLEVKSLAEDLRKDSLAFQPYVSVIETKVTQAVKIGTVAFGLAVSAIAFWLIRKLGEAHRAREKEARKVFELATIAERTNDSILLTDPEGVTTWANSAFSKLSGYSPEEIIGKRPGDVLQGKMTAQHTRRRISQALAEIRPIKCEILNLARDGRPYWIDLSISPLNDSQGKLNGFVAISSDISERRQQLEALENAKREIEHQALHDALTQLPNRRAFDAALSQRHSETGDVAVLRIDLDHFKYVNDTQGHEAGDHVLVTVAGIMLEEIGSDDIPARLGGDEFAVLMGAGREMPEAEDLGRRLLNRIRAPMSYEGKVVQVGASFGAASTKGGLLDKDGLMVGADAALYQAKEAGRNRVHLYSPALHQEINERLSLSEALVGAIAEQEFVPFYHPQIDAKTMRVTGVETLVRWPSKQFGLVMPDTFMPVAERLTLVDDIDAIVLQKAVSEIAEIRKAGFGPEKVSFNVTSSRLQDPSLLKIVQQLELGTLKLSFEVLESVLIEEQSNRFHESVSAFREIGIGIEIDDFGSGHASIAGLMSLLPDVLKIDRKLVKEVVTVPVQRSIVSSVIDIARAMGVSVTAEGVETIEHADILTQIGVDTLQGFFFAKPLSGPDLETFLFDFGHNLHEVAGNDGRRTG